MAEKWLLEHSLLEPCNLAILSPLWLSPNLVIFRFVNLILFPKFISQCFFFFFFNRGGKCSKLEVWEMLEPELYLCS